MQVTAERWTGTDRGRDRGSGIDPHFLLESFGNPDSGDNRFRPNCRLNLMAHIGGVMRRRRHRGCGPLLAVLDLPGVAALVWVRFQVTDPRQGVTNAIAVG